MWATCRAAVDEGSIHSDISRHCVLPSTSFLKAQSKNQSESTRLVKKQQVIDWQKVKVRRAIDNDKRSVITNMTKTAQSTGHIHFEMSQRHPRKDCTDEYNREYYTPIVGRGPIELNYTNLSRHRNNTKVKGLQAFSIRRHPSQVIVVTQRPKQEYMTGKSEMLLSMRVQKWLTEVKAMSDDERFITATLKNQRMLPTLLVTNSCSVETKGLLQYDGTIPELAKESTTATRQRINAWICVTISV